MKITPQDFKEAIELADFQVKIDNIDEGYVNEISDEIFNLLSALKQFSGQVRPHNNSSPADAVLQTTLPQLSHFSQLFLQFFGQLHIMENALNVIVFLKQINHFQDTKRLFNRNYFCMIRYSFEFRAGDFKP